jgi:hypothetical protein
MGGAHIIFQLVGKTAVRLIGIALGDAMEFYVSFAWPGLHFIGGKSVVARLLFMLALENPSCCQQSFESGTIEGGALAHAEIASIDGWARSKKGHDDIRFSYWRWCSLGDPRKHEMKILCRAAPRTSASFHQRHYQWG